MESARASKSTIVRLATQSDRERIYRMGHIANFLLCHLPNHGPTAATLAKQCRKRGLFVRDAAAMGRSLGQHALRIAVKDEQTNRRMLEIVAHALSSFAKFPRQVGRQPVIIGAGDAEALDTAFSGESGRVAPHGLKCEG